eukprot:gene14551-17197_t
MSLDFKIGTASTSATLLRAIDRYTDYIFTETAYPSKSHSLVEITSLLITVHSEDEELQMGVDESYQLTVNPDGAEITANTVYGAMRGLETFSQLAKYNYTEMVYNIKHCPWMVVDKPRFPHRGISLDTSRHYIPVITLYELLDSLEFAKMNVFHWHIVDAQSFPLQSLLFPKLWKGAWSPSQVYTQTDVFKIVQYAKDRGIRVVVEIDMPGHAYSVLYTLALGLIDELTNGANQLFTDSFFSKTIAKWMNQMGFTEFSQATQYFESKVHEKVTQNNRSPIVWEDSFFLFGNTLPKNVVVQIYHQLSTLQAAVAQGYRALASNCWSWYLDLNGTWEMFYLNDITANVTEANMPLVLGGETALWGEVMDISDLFSKVWPKTACAAERLWSPSYVNDTVAVVPRLERFRCHMMFRGVESAPLNSTSPVNPGSCYTE